LRHSDRLYLKLKGITAMKSLLVLIIALFATGCTTSSLHKAAAGYCEKGDPAYDQQRCFDYWTAVNRNVLG
jgi:hypothetical protein